MSGASKYYIVKVFTVGSNIAIKIKNHTFPDILATSAQVFLGFPVSKSKC